VDNKIFSIKDLAGKVKDCKKRGKKIVLCHGVYDLLHIGHIKHFKEAKKNGDLLIVTVTIDKHVHKGPNRPEFKIQQRLEALSAIEFIDFVAASKFTSAVEVIKIIRPNVYCKGPDYIDEKNDLTGKIKDEKLAVNTIGGKILFTKSETFSSSKLLNKFGNALSKEQKTFTKHISEEFNSDKIARINKDLKKLKVLVIGETIIDKYVFCETLGKSGKEPHLVLKYMNEQFHAGGAAAIALHLSSFCKSITLLSALGKNKIHEKFIKKTIPKNIKTNFLYKKNSPTIEKTRFIDYVSKSKMLGVYKINDDKLSNSEEYKFKKIILRKIKNFDIVIVSDYGHGLISKKIAKLICKKSKFLALNAQVNASNIGYHSIQKYKNIDCVIINEVELRHELRDKISKTEVLIKRLAKSIRARDLVVTKGSDGAIMYSSKTNRLIYCPAFASKVIDKLGAGDAMLSVLSILLKSKFEKKLSLFLGSLASAQSVEIIGNSKHLNKIKLLKYAQHVMK